MNRSTELSASPYSDHKFNNNGDRSDKSKTKLPQNVQDRDVRSKSELGSVIQGAKKKTLNVSHDQIKPNHSSSKHVFDYAPKLQSKNRTKIKTNNQTLSKASKAKLKKNKHKSVNKTREERKLAQHALSSDYSSEQDHDIPDVVKSPNDGALLSKKLIVQDSPRSNNEYEHDIYGQLQSEDSISSGGRGSAKNPDKHKLNEDYHTYLSNKSESIKSLDLMNKRPTKAQK